LLSVVLQTESLDDLDRKLHTDTYGQIEYTGKDFSVSRLAAIPDILHCSCLLSKINIVFLRTLSPNNSVMAIRDNWPKMQDGIDFNNYVLSCLQPSESDSMLRLTRKLGDAQGFHLKLSNQPDIVSRLARIDVNMPNFDGFPIEVRVPKARFEVAVYELLHSAPNILAARLLYPSAACWSWHISFPSRYCGPSFALV
jgi:hypothetical protein